MALCTCCGLNAALLASKVESSGVCANKAGNQSNDKDVEVNFIELN